MESVFTLVAVILFDAEEPSNLEILSPEILDGELINSVFQWLKSEDLGGQHSIDWPYATRADKKELILCLLIPHNKLITEHYQVEWVRLMTEGEDLAPLIVMI